MLIGFCRFQLILSKTITLDAGDFASVNVEQIDDIRCLVFLVSFFIIIIFLIFPDYL